jgi:hypothetical protein
MRRKRKRAARIFECDHVWAGSDDAEDVAPEDDGSIAEHRGRKVVVGLCGRRPHWERGGIELWLRRQCALTRPSTALLEFFFHPGALCLSVWFSSI